MVNNTKKLGVRLKTARKAHRFTQLDIAKRLGVRGPNVSRWEKGDVAPGAKHLPRLAKALGVRVEWLLTGEGEMSVGEEGGVRYQEASVEALHIKEGPPVSSKKVSAGPIRIPIIGEVSDGKAAIYWEAPTERFVVGVHVSEKAFALRVSDNSMETEYSERDVIVVDPLAEVENGDTAIVEHGGEKTFRKILFGDDCITCQPLKKEQDAFSIPCVEKTRLVGRVMARTTVY